LSAKSHLIIAVFFGAETEFGASHTPIHSKIATIHLTFLEAPQSVEIG
jgi:hypothetical protein